MIADQVATAMKNADFNSVGECRLKRYTYDYDPTEAAWITSTLQYQVKFYS